MWKLAVASGVALSLFSASRPALAQTSGLTVTESKDEPPRYYGLHFDLSVYDGSGLNSVGHNYRNDLSFYFEPSWDIGKTFPSLRKTRWKGLQLAARFVVTANLSGTDEAAFSGNNNSTPQGTCGNPTISSNGGLLDPGSVSYCNPASATRRADYSDFWLTLRAPSVYKYSIPEYSFAINPAIRGVFPTSMESRFATLIAAVTPSIGMTHTFWKGRLHGGFSFGVTKNFHKQSTVTYTSSTNGTVTTNGGNPYDGALSSGLSNFYADPSRQASFGGLNTNFALLSIISGGVQFNDKWSFDALYIVSNAYPYSQDCIQQVQGYSVDLCGNGNAVAASSGSALWRPGRRDNQTFWATLNYQPWEWIGFSVAWINSAPMWKPDSTYRQGIISTDYNAYTTVSFGTSISIDHFAEMLEKRNKKKHADPVAKSNAVSIQ
jgi:hypothetical protein